MLAQLSDPHIRLDEGAAESAAALAHAVDAVLRLDPAPDAVLLSGDLANGGSAPEYARVRELLSPLPMPVHVLPGNHDDVAALEAVFGPAEFATTAGPLRLVGVDTSIPGEDGGRLPLERLAAFLEQDATTPTIVAMHHAPITTGIPPMDAIGLPADDKDQLAELLKAHPQVKRIACGHVHRAIVGAIGGVPVFTCPGTHWQLVLDLRATTIEVGDDPPGYALHLLADGDVTSHVVSLASHPTG